jgi:hypothetical protein
MRFVAAWETDKSDHGLTARHRPMKIGPQVHQASGDTSIQPHVDTWNAANEIKPRTAFTAAEAFLRKVAS